MPSILLVFVILHVFLQILRYINPLKYEITYPESFYSLILIMNNKIKCGISHLIKDKTLKIDLLTPETPDLTCKFPELLPQRSHLELYQIKSSCKHRITTPSHLKELKEPQ